MVTVRTTAFDKAGLTGSGASVEEIPEVSTDSACTAVTDRCTISQDVKSSWCRHGADPLATTKFVSEELTVSSRPDLASAPRVVSGGRALKSQENFNKVLDPLADALNAGELTTPASRTKSTPQESSRIQLMSTSCRCVPSRCGRRIRRQLVASWTDRQGERCLRFLPRNITCMHMKGEDLSPRSSRPSSTSPSVSPERSNISPG